MQALQRTIQQIATQLKTLSPTAKLLIGSLMVILAMSLFMVSLYAGGVKMAPLGLGSNLSADARARAISFLESRNIPHEPSGSDVLVPVEQKLTIMGQLTENKLVGPDQINFDTLMKEDSPFRTSQQNRMRYQVAKMNVLAAMIGQMSGIEHATVVLDQPEGAGGIGRSHISPSASVTVTTNGSELTQSQVDAIAGMVVGSHAGLKAEHVKVIDTRGNRVMTARTNDSMNSGRYLEVKLAAERHAKANLEGALSYISGVMIAVNAQVDTKEVVQQSSKVEDPKIGVTDSTSRNVTSSNQSGGSEPGMRPNVGLSIDGNGGAGSQMTDELTKESSIPVFPVIQSNIRDFKGYALKINASVGVPKSYFIHLYQDRQGDATKQPDAAALEALITQETEKIKQFVTPLIDTEGLDGAVAGIVTVSEVPDFAVSGGGGNSAGGGSFGGSGAGGGGGDGGGSSLVSEGLVKYIGLGALAAVSLAMMFLMVRKAGVRETLPTASEMVGIPPALAAAETDLVGEADEASPALEGVELTDESIRRQQMLEQISDMVVSSPDEAAGLMRRWMKSEA